MHTCSYSETSTYGALLGSGPWVLQRQSLKESVPLHCGSTQTAMLALLKGPSRQLTDTVPELPRRSTNYNSTLWQHSTLHLYQPAFGKHSISWPSGHKGKLSIEDRNKGSFLKYFIESQDADLQCQKMSTTHNSSTNIIFSNFSITATEEDHKNYQALGLPQVDLPWRALSENCPKLKSHLLAKLGVPLCNTG